MNEIESITMLALARSANTGLADGKLIPEVLIIGLKLTAKATEMPSAVIELIAGQRKSGIVFACVREVPFEGRTRDSKPMLTNLREIISVLRIRHSVTKFTPNSTRQRRN